MMKKLVELNKSMAADNEEDLGSSKNYISQINSRSRRRSTIFGLNGIPIVIPPESGIKIGQGRDERKDMYMKLLQVKVEDSETVKDILKQDITGRNAFIKQYQQAKSALEAKALVQETEKARLIQSIELFSEDHQDQVR